MLYGLRFVPDHPVYRLHEAFGYFLDEGLRLETFDQKCFPKWFKPVLSASPGLSKRSRVVHSESRKHEQGVRDAIVAVWRSHAEVQSLCEDVKCKLEEWGFAAQELIDQLFSLFNFLYDETLESKSFEKAAGKSLLDHYNSFRGLGQRVCPFCGLNYYADRGGGARNSYDHFLPRLYYPLAAVNFRNLVPMCDECNERPRKGTKDVLFRDEGRTTRRKFYYPYSTPGGVTLSVKCTKRPTPTNTSGAWTVNVKAIKTAENSLVRGWDSVFDIETRFSARVKEGMESWMRDFLNSRDYPDVPSVTRLRKDLSAKAAWLSKPEQLRSKAEAALQSAAFGYMAGDAPDDILAGYAAMATSLAVVGIPTALGRN
jgi:hypothetical protein